MNFTGTIGNNTRNGTGANDKFFYGQGGNDKLKGLAGNDAFLLGAKLNPLDAIDGGVGIDTLTLAGNYAAGVVFGATTLLNVEKIVLSVGFSYKLTTHDKTVAAGKTLTVDGHALGAGKALTFDGSHETNGHLSIIGGAGNDVLTGGALSDIFNLTRGGNDTAKGGGGNDTFRLGARMTAADKIDGAAGTNDTVTLAGDYSAGPGLAFSATTMVNVEKMVLADGFSYILSLTEATVAAGHRLTVDGSALSAGHFLNFDPTSNDSDGAFTVFGGAGDDGISGGAGGNDVLNGGGGDDQFHLAVFHGGAADHADTVNGGAGNDTIRMGRTLDAADRIDGGADGDTLVLDGDYSVGITFGAATVVDVEMISLFQGSSYRLTTADENVAAGQFLTVDGSSLVSTDSLTFDGHLELDGQFLLLGGAGADDLTGGVLDDRFIGDAGEDTIDGGGGSDTADYSDKPVSVIVTLNGSTLVDVSVDGTVEDHIRNIENIVGGSVGDTLTGDGGANTFDLSHGGDDTADGAGSDDTFDMGVALTTDDQIDGGGGNDTVILNGDYSSVTLFFSPTTMVNVENLTLFDGFSYNLVTSFATVATGETLTVDAHVLSATNGLTFDSGEDNGNVVIIGGAGNDTVAFGNHADVFAASTVDGGAGDDEIRLFGDYSGAHAVVFLAATVKNVEVISVGGDSDYDLTSVDATVAAGQSLHVLGDQSPLRTLTFDGSAETDGTLTLGGRPGNDVLTGGHLGDTFDLGPGGDDVADGGGGDDTFNMLAAFTSADTINGGDGDDTVVVEAPSAASAIVFTSTTMTNVEHLVINSANQDTTLTTADATVASGATLEIDESGTTGNMTFDGSAETDGSFHIIGGFGNDVLTGGDLGDEFTFKTTVFGQDTISNFSPGTDKIRLIGTDFADFSDVQTHMDDSSGHVVITDDHGNTISLTTVANTGDLSADEFLFA